MIDGEQIPGAEPTGVEGTSEAVVDAGTPEVGSVEGMPEAAPEPYDQDAVMSAGGEPALKQYKDLQRRFQREVDKSKGIGPLEKHLDGLGGGQGVLQILERFNGLLSNQAMLRAITQFEQTGSLPTGRPAYEEPETYEEEETPLIKRLDALEGRAAQLEGKLGQQGIRGHLEALKEEFPNVPDWLPNIETELQNWSRDPARRAILANVDYETLKMMVLRTLYGDAESRAKHGAQEYNRLLELKKARTTDRPQVGATTGAEPPAGTVATFQQAFDEFKRREGVTTDIRYEG